MLPDWADKKLSEDIPVIRARGENQDLEFMESFPKNISELAKEIAAFATVNQGTILLGVADNGDLIGIEDLQTTEQRDSYLRRIEGICRGTVKPAITPTVKFAIENGKTVLFIFVPKGSQPVYYSNHIPYIRHITEARPAEPHEIIELVRKWIPASQSGHEEIDPFSQLISRLSFVIIDILIYGEEAEQRDCNPWLDMWRSQFAQAASELRDFAVSDIAIERGLSEGMNELANSLDVVANFRMTLGCWPELKTAINLTLEKTRQIKTKWIDIVSLSEVSISQIKKTIIESQRKLSNICLRTNEEDYIERNVDDFQAEVSEVGYTLLRLSYYNLDIIKQGLNSALQPIARDLHLIETERLYLDGGHSIKMLVDRVKKDSEDLNKILEE
ncbi:MAG: ATP-binding protein [Sedimentisphaerales bacterium]|jgi:hypothetical protein